MKRVPTFLAPGIALAAAVPMAIEPGSTLADTSYAVAFSTLVVLAWVRRRSFTGPVRTGYTLIVSALTVWLSGDLLQDLLTWAYGPLGDVSVSDFLWLGGYPVIATGLIRLTFLRAPGRLRESMLDALTMATVVASLLWQFLILPASEHQDLTLSVVVGALYPFGDILLFAVTALLVLAPGSKRGSTPYLVAALTLSLLGDVLISMLPALLPSLSRSGQAERLDGLLLVANSLFVAALLHPAASRIADPGPKQEERLHPARVIFLGVALLVLPTIAGLRSFDSTLSRVSLLCSVTVLTALILVRFVFVVREQERGRAALAHQAAHDQLTGLANRPALRNRLEGALTHRKGGYGPVIFYLDLNGFKQINDHHGHAAGDFLLVEFAHRLRSELRGTDVAARLGGDEFVVLSEEIENEAAARAVEERLRHLVNEPVCRGDDCFTVGVSIGIAAAGDLTRPDVDALLAAADADMYQAKIRNKRAAADPAGDHRLTLRPAVTL
jgi:diguanylate cyclase (GGDEF)-like protein